MFVLVFPSNIILPEVGGTYRYHAPPLTLRADPDGTLPNGVSHILGIRASVPSTVHGREVRMSRSQLWDLSIMPLSQGPVPTSTPTLVFTPLVSLGDYCEMGGGYIPLYSKVCRACINP